MVEYGPVEIDDATLALDAIREVGHGGHFFGVDHTMERYRTCFHRPVVASKQNIERWRAAGSLTAEQRAQAKKNYEELIATAQWPNKPDGKPANYLAAIKLAVAFAGAKNEKRAREFLAFMMEEANLTPYTEGALGRWYPVTKAAADRDFWTKEDKHRKAVSDQFRAGTGTFPFTRNWKFTILNNENVWAKAMSRVVNDKWTPERAADELIARAMQVAGG